MSFLFERSIARHVQSKQILILAQNDARSRLAKDPEVSAFQINSPDATLDELIEHGFKGDSFWRRALQIVQTSISTKQTLSNLRLLEIYCHPDNRGTQTINLDIQIPRPNTALQKAFGHLGKLFEDSWQEIFHSAAGTTISYIGMEDLPLARYRRDFISKKFQSHELPSGGAIYTLPTALEEVVVDLLYIRESIHPLSRIKVKPLTP